jgi:DNA-binding transcriptional MerR regulator
MQKSDDAFRTIGEMADLLGVKTHILRYWEEQFPMLSPLKRAGGRRYYRAEDVALLHRINGLLNREGYTIKGARKTLQSSGASLQNYDAMPLARDTAATSAISVEQLTIVPELRVIRDRLALALEAA